MNDTSHGVNSFVYKIEDAPKIQKQLLSRFPEFDISVVGLEDSTTIEITVYPRQGDRKLASTHIYQEDFIGLPGATIDGVLQTVEALVGSSDLTIE